MASSSDIQPLGDVAIIVSGGKALLLLNQVSIKILLPLGSKNSQNQSESEGIRRFKM
jgi:hypothetical protein